MQKNQHRAAFFACAAARQCDAVGQKLLGQFNHGAINIGAVCAVFTLARGIFDTRFGLFLVCFDLWMRPVPQMLRNLFNALFFQR